MRAILIAMLAAGAFGLLSTSGTSAAPVNNAAIAAATSPVVKARQYCYRHYSNSRRRFLHWGHC
jgi:hypothetical protein